MEFLRSKEEAVPIMKEKCIKADDLSRILNADKLLLNNMSDVCFRRCVLSLEKEYLNPLEQNCVDRCVNKYD